ncbi:TIGR02147 family protein [Bdellovibrio bacteriovorus]|nr:TIGR02147 family protein [Bdellovibrio bacteriovorus]
MEKIRLILLEEFVKAQARNPSYSMRSYSKKIGVSQAAVSEVLSGKRPLTAKTAQKILSGLDKSPAEIAGLLEAQERPQASKYKSLDMDTFHLISEWHYYAILSLAETKDFKGTAPWIAERLGLSKKLTEEALERLLRLGMLEKSKVTGEVRTTGEQFEAISEIATPALKKANRQNIELITDALESVPVERRDFTAMTLCFDPDRLNDARKMIKNFRRDFTRVMESGKKKEVYKICIQLFPLTGRAK